MAHRQQSWPVIISVRGAGRCFGCIVPSEQTASRRKDSQRHRDGEQEPEPAQQAQFDDARIRRTARARNAATVVAAAIQIGRPHTRRSASTASPRCASGVL